jgi:hypothetical protein
MTAPVKTIHVLPDSELFRILEAAAGEEIVLEKEGVHYRLVPDDLPLASEPKPRRRKLDPDRVLDIIGIGASAEDTHIARFKDDHLAEAADRRDQGTRQCTHPRTNTTPATSSQMDQST